MIRIYLMALPVLFLSLAANAAEPEFKPLFNGQDLAGWTPVDGPAESWGVEGDGVFTTGKGGGWLSTDKEYGNFELRLEFKLPAGGNSGVFIRAPREGQPWIDGMEVQILDDDDAQYANLEPGQYCGSVYKVAAAKRGSTKKPGEWQSMSIRCAGPQVTVALNGQTVVDTDLSQAQDKQASNPGISRKSGHIGLQNHGSRLDFRKVQIRELN
ncbi:MAG: DUF1080 domain-containing protein [Pirellulales bacterium]